MRAAPPWVVVLDHGSGNLHSAVRALGVAGARVELSADPARALAADGLVVPGVGAFATCAEGLRAVGGEQVVRERHAQGRPTLGICVGLQVLFTAGIEHGEQSRGLGLWPGVVEQVRARRLPHMGWNQVTAPAGSRLFDGLGGERFYFVHSYAVREVEALRATGAQVSTVEHGGDVVVAAVEDGPSSATQFHPEKSGAAGAALLRGWVSRLPVGAEPRR